MQLHVDDFHSSPTIPDCHANTVIYDNRNNGCDDHHNRDNRCVNQFIGLKRRISDPRTRARSQQRMSAAVGNHCASRLGECGVGVNGGATRRIGASSDQVTTRHHVKAVEEPGEPNAETVVEHLGDGLYRLTPRTGRTHQLRVHMASLDLPIIGDPLYPKVMEVADDDFSMPLQLLAHSLEFDDPLNGRRREFVSRRTLAPFPAAGGSSMHTNAH